MAKRLSRDSMLKFLKRNLPKYFTGKMRNPTTGKISFFVRRNDTILDPRFKTQSAARAFAVGRLTEEARQLQRRRLGFRRSLRRKVRRRRSPRRFTRKRRVRRKKRRN